MSTRGPLAILAVLFAGYVGICILYVNEMNRRSLDSAAIDNAQRYTDVVSAFRTTYTAQVVSKAKAKGLDITHDAAAEDSIPLPATMSILIGEQLAKEERGLKVSLYSPYPFPWRRNGGLGDEFGLNAWRVLSQDREAIYYYEFVESAGERYIRYAVADVMRPDCVNCHNTHPESPKRDWSAGDVRGVLEVSFPVIRSRRAESPFIGGMFLFLTGCAAFLVVALVLRRLRDQIEAKRVSDSELALAHLEIQQSRQRVVEEKLEVIGHLAAGIAYDFNNVLMIVMGYTDMAIKDIVKGSKAYTYLEKSRIAARRARALANKLPIVHSAQGFHPTRINLNEVVKSTVDLLSPLINAKTTLEIVATDEPVEVLAEADQIERLLINLAINAVDAIGDTGHITISVSKFLNERGHRTQAVLSVSDTGPGVSTEARAHLFEPFFTTKTSGDTAGLGLFTVQQITLQHGGSIEVDSVPGEGATFRVLFPVPESPSLQEAASSDRGARDAAHILVVDDEYEVRQLLVSALVDAGFRVTEAIDGEQAMEVFGEHADAFDLVLTDMRMPKMDGREFAGSVRELRPNQRLLFVSGYEEDCHSLDEDFSSRVAFLKKPVSPEDVVDTVESLLTPGQ